MSDSNSAVLQRAYELVEAGQPGEAQLLVESVLDAERTNPDAWWIYAHALEDPARARQALNEVLTLDPNYPGAASLRAVLDAQYPDLTVGALAGEIEPLDDIPDSLFDEPDDERLGPAGLMTSETVPDESLMAEPNALEEPSFVGQVSPVVPPVVVREREKSRGLPWLWFAAATVGAILLFALIVLLLVPPRAATVTPTADANSVAGLPTLEPGAEVMTTEDAVPGGEATADSTEVTVPLLDVTPLVPVATLPLDAVMTLTPLPAGEVTPEVPDVVVGPEVTTEATALLPEPVPTEALVLPGPTVDAAAQDVIAGLPDGVLPEPDLASLASDLTTYEIPASALSIQSTPMGETLVASFCTQDGPELRDLTRQVMDTVAARAEIMEPALGAVGVRAVNCETGETLRLLSAERGAAQSYAQGAITREAFESQWLSL